ncbi:MAG: class I SAM-dependent methyltransferase, partial [Comamonadaceae bacterium]
MAPSLNTPLTMHHNNILRHLYAEHQGKVSDKWSIYLDVYERLFASRRADPVRLLEIGIQNGGSLEIWARYFPKALSLVGCDIDPACRGLRFDDPRISVVVGDANTDQAAHDVLAHGATLDIVLDDGSHQSGDIVRSFHRYFPHVAQGGVFVAEDLHCSYWQGFQGGLQEPASSLAFFRRLSDVINHEHWGNGARRADLLATLSQAYGIEFDDALLSSIHSVEFVNSLCIVRKEAATSNVLGPRVIAGREALVDPQGVQMALDGTLSVAPDQTANPFSAARPLPEERIGAQEERIEALEADVESLRRKVQTGVQHPMHAPRCRHAIARSRCGRAGSVNGPERPPVAA